MKLHKKEDTFIKIMQMGIGTKVKSLAHFHGVPEGTEGIIDEDYGTGFMVSWKLTMPLRDGFDKKTELVYLEIIE